MGEKVRNTVRDWASIISAVVVVATVIFYSGTDHQKLSDLSVDVAGMKTTLVDHEKRLGAVEAVEAVARARAGTAAARTP